VRVCLLQVAEWFGETRVRKVRVRKSLLTLTLCPHRVAAAIIRLRQAPGANIVGGMS